jgi:ATP-binding cassette subfamily F protein uup
MADLLLTLKDIHLTFGGTPLLEGAELTVASGDRIGLVGRNGSGKSTLMKIAAGLVPFDKGERFVHPNARIAYLTQEVNFEGFATTLEFAEADLAPADDHNRARLLLDKLGLTGYEDTAALSGGEARRAAIARALAPQPDVLLLDEPTNHLDLPAIEWLERELARTRAALVLISHDRRFLEALSRATVWLDRGRARRTDRGFAFFEEWRDQVLEEEETNLHKLDRKIAREEHWMHGGVTGRRKRNVRRVAELAELRRQKREARAQTGNVRLEGSEAGQSGRLVVEATGLCKDYGAGPVVEDLSIKIMRGDRLGLVGPNGAGKTTVLKMLIGELAPDAGIVRLGTNLETITIDQKRETLKPEITVADALTGGRGDWIEINGQKRHVSSYLKDFLFLPEQSRSPIKVLSGGERARLLLARSLAKPSNLIVLDEPTNDLDLETLDLLQEYLAAYPGTVILVSHDRDFLDRVATSVLVAEGGGRWSEYTGGYTDMLAQRGAAPVKDNPKTADRRENQPPLAKTAPSAATAKRKLSFKDKHALEELPKRMAAIETEIAKLGVSLSDPALFTRDPAGFNAATDKIARLQSELEAAETRWLELELLKEELES